MGWEGCCILTHSLPPQRPQDGAGRTLEVAGDPPEAGASFPHPPDRLHLLNDSRVWVGVQHFLGAK